MTLPADNKSEDDKTPETGKKPDVDKKPDVTNAGKALAPAGTGPVNPFLSATLDDKADPPKVERSFLSRMLDYSAHAAIIVGLIGFAWSVSSHMLNKPAAKDGTTQVAGAALPVQPVDEMTQMRLANQKMHDEIKALKANLDALRTTVRHDTTPEQVRMLTAGLDNLKSGIGTTNDAIAQLNSKIDKFQPNKIQALTERVVRLERDAAIDPAATASIEKPASRKADPRKSEAMNADDADGPSTIAPKMVGPKAEATKAVPKPPMKPTALASAESTPGDTAADKPQVISGWVVRDVYQGVALVEGKRGTLEVVPGVTIPGAGVVKSIDRHNGSWVVTTTKGEVAAAAPTRRNPYQRGMYGSPYRYDY